MNKNVSSIKDTILSFKEEIIKIKIQYIEKVDNKIDLEEVKLNEYVNNLNEYRKQIKDINDQIIEIQDREDIKDIQINRNKLEFEINKFFKDFEILEPYHDIDEAINIIKIKCDELENDFNRKEQENKEKIPMYEKISNYISMTDVIESDRKKYKKNLFENANVFGITCTSKDQFRGRDVEALSEYNIEGLDIKSIGYRCCYN